MLSIRLISHGQLGDYDQSLASSGAYPPKGIGASSLPKQTQKPSNNELLSHLHPLTVSFLIFSFFDLTCEKTSIGNTRQGITKYTVAQGMLTF